MVEGRNLKRRTRYQHRPMVDWLSNNPIQNLIRDTFMRPNDYLMMQLFSGGLSSMQSSGWLHVVFLIFLLAVPIFRPERIRVVASFRRAWVCFALSMIAPSAASILTSNLIMPGVAAGNMPTGTPLLSFFNAAGPVFFGMSLVFAMKAVVPGFIPPPDFDRSSRFDDHGSASPGGTVGSGGPPAS